MKLYWGSGSPPCMKVIMVLEEIGKWASCDEKQINFFPRKEHKGPEVMKTNPRGQVPTFIDDDISINESVAICIYLDETYGQKNKLIPSDRTERALVLQRMFEVPNISSNVTAPLLYNTDKTDMDKKVATAHTELLRWNEYLATGTYLAGEKFTMADVFLYNELVIYVRHGLNLAKLYPHLHKYYEVVRARPSADTAYPPHYKEEPSKNALQDFKPPVATK